MALPDERERGFTYADYLTWSDEERWEIIDGVPYSMSPAPDTTHQYIAAQLTSVFVGAVSGKPCTVFAAPTDVVLPDPDLSEEESVTVVQPDLSVVCAQGKITQRSIVGAPDLVVEILSPSTGFKDQTVKFALYETSGVREYWIINPDTRVVEVFVREDATGRFPAPRWYREPGEVESDVLETTVDLDTIWPGE